MHTQMCIGRDFHRRSYKVVQQELLAKEMPLFIDVNDSDTFIKTTLNISHRNYSNHCRFTITRKETS